MITPFFTINQDEEFIYIDVKISHVRFNARSIEMIVENELFIFSLPPYYLRIRLPFPCVDDDRSHAEFDSKTECVKIKIPKETKGQFFPDLDLTAKLLARTSEAGTIQLQLQLQLQRPSDEVKVMKMNKPLIEELDVNNDISNDQAEKDLQEGEHFNWEVEQSVPTAPTLELGGDGVAGEVLNFQESEGLKYGFNNQYDGIVGVSVSNGNDINGLGNPEATHATDRVIERLIKENIQFDPEIYAADYIMEKYPSTDDDKSFKDLIEWKNPQIQKFLKWYKSQQLLLLLSPLLEHKKENSTENIMPVEFNEEEQKQMMNLPRKTYLLEEEQKRESLIAIVCLLFAYQFDMRETEGEHNIESAWTIGKIAPQFSFLDAKLVVNDTNQLKAGVIVCTRRALTFPYHRSFGLCKKVWSDVYLNLRGGKRLVLKSLLDLKELFRFHDIYYVYDKIWMEDLCAYLVSDNVSEATIRNLAHDLKNVVDSTNESDITFEKSSEEESQSMEEDGDEIEGEGEMVVLTLKEIQEMAESLYQEYRQTNG